MSLDRKLVFPVLIHQPGVFGSEVIGVADSHERASVLLAEWCFDGLMNLGIDSGFDPKDDDSVIGAYFEAQGDRHNYSISATPYVFSV